MLFVKFKKVDPSLMLTERLQTGSDTQAADVTAAVEEFTTERLNIETVKHAGGDLSIICASGSECREGAAGS